MIKYSFNIDGENFDLIPFTSTYLDGSLAICLAADKFLGLLTTSLSDSLLYYNQQYVDVKQYPWAEEFIKQYKLGKPKNYSKVLGNYSYPLYEFDLDKFNKEVNV